MQIQHLQSLDRGTFLDWYFDYLDHKPSFEKIRTILYIELGIRPQNGHLESQIIKTVLDGKLNFNKYARAHMKKGDIYYLLNKKFFD